MMVSTLPPPPFSFLLPPPQRNKEGEESAEEILAFEARWEAPETSISRKNSGKKKIQHFWKKKVEKVKKEGYKNLLDNSQKQVFLIRGIGIYMLLFLFFLCWTREKQRQSAKRNANQVSKKSRNRLDKPVFLLQVQRGNFLFFSRGKNVGVSIEYFLGCLERIFLAKRREWEMGENGH